MLFGALCSGRTLHLISAERAFDPDAFAEYMSRHQVDVLKIVPSHLQALLSAGSPADVLPARRLVLGGEATPWRLLDRIAALKPGCQVLNHYGPTETTVGILTQAAGTALRSAGTLPVGKPLGNSHAYVLDADLNPAPVGVSGELYLGGAGAARGYQAQAAQTAERFIASPFLAGERLYRTGDRVKMLEDRSLEFLGRVDDQVKVRGYRVELREVAQALRVQAGILEAEVIAREDAEGRTQLYAYVVAPAGERIDVAEARDALARSLPDYMLPAAITQLDALPLTANGKVDRKALPEPAERTVRRFEAPAGDVETVLADVWQQVLKVDQVGRHDNFFELGGDSILTLQIVARARKRGLRFSPKALMEGQTVAAVASVATLDVKAVSAPTVATSTGTTEAIAPTPVQAWFFEQAFEDSHHWNQSLLLSATEAIEPAQVQQAIDAVVAHHEALRYSFNRAADGRWSQTPQPPGQAVFERIDLSLERDAAAAITNAADRVQQSLTLQRPFKAVWMDLGAGRAGRLLLVAHHLVVDGVSWRVILDDLQTVYRQLREGRSPELPPTTTSFRDWSVALARHAESPELRAEQTYWQSVVGRAEPSLPGVTEGSNTVADARTISTTLDELRTEQLLGDVPQAYRTRIDEVLLTALARTLCAWDGRDSVLVELEGKGREAHPFSDVDLSRTVGLFTAPYPVRLAPEEGARDTGANPGSSLKSIKEQLRRVPQKGLGYGVLRYLSTEAQSLARAAYPQVTFNYLGQTDQHLGSDSVWRVARENAGQERASGGQRRTWLSIDADIHRGELRVRWTYSNAVHDAFTVQELAHRFLDELQALIEHCLSGANGVTPSDFPLALLSQDQLDHLPLPWDRLTDLYPLSPMQAGMLFHSILEQDGTSYVNQLRMDLEGLDAARFKADWRLLIDRHDMLRTGFVQGETALQWVARSVDLPLVEHDWSHRSDLDEALDALAQVETERGFDLAAPPLMRLVLVQSAAGRHHLIWTCHHLMLDGWSSARLMAELLARHAGQIPAPPLGRYRDYIGWLQQRDSGAAEQYWRTLVAGLEEPSRLASVLKLVSDGDGRLGHTVVFDEAETARMVNFARAERVTMNTLVQAAWALLLQHYTGQTSVSFGATTSGRPSDLPGADEVLGLFINTLPVVAHRRPGQQVGEWLRELQAQNIASREHEHTPLVDIQRWAGVSGQGLFDSILVFENYPVDEALRNQSGTLRVSLKENLEDTNYLMTVKVHHTDTLTIGYALQGGGISVELIDGMAAHHIAALRELTQTPQKRLGEIQLLDQAERQQLSAWSGSEQRYPAVESAHRLFELQAQDFPEAMAVVFNDERLSYADLNTRANRLAHKLIDLGVRPEAKVGIAVERSIEMLVGLLAILKAGGAYVPLDPDYPADRLAYMMKDSGIELLLTQSWVREKLPACEALRVLELDTVLLSDGAIGRRVNNPHLKVHADNLAYVIYTSGSTGKPKGAQLCHSNVTRLLKGTEAWFEFGKHDVWTMFHSYAFDFSVWEIFGALCTGGQLVIVPHWVSRSPADFLHLLRRHRVTVLNQTPSAFGQLMNVPDFYSERLALRAVIFGGEALDPQCLRPVIEYWRDKGPRLINMYGITETTVHVTYRPITEADVQGQRSPVGIAIPDLGLWVLDGSLNFAAIGVAGELYVAGDGLARGYLGRTGLTAERFIANPFGGSGNRLYRTGDLVRWNSEGQLEYLGRIDHQVKVRGFRIELGEVESQLLSQPDVREAVVLAKEGPSGAKLVGYVSGQSGQSIKGGELRERLGRHLPDYMVPSAIVVLDALPLNANGKVDRKALPAPEFEGAEEYTAPQGEIEEALASVWAEVLGVGRVGRHDNFFELGGDSILSLRVVSRAHSQSLPLVLSYLFEHQNLAAVAQAIQRSSLLEEAVIPALPTASRDASLPVSYAQLRQWFLWRLNPESTAYHISGALRLRGELDVNALKSSFASLVSRHESLRTVFCTGPDGHVEQLILREGKIQIQVLDLSTEAIQGRSEQVRIEAARLNQTPFDLERGPLLRVGLIREAVDAHVLVVVMHHIISDGWSMQVIVDEFVTQYRARVRGRVPEQAELPIQYADYAVWQRAWMEAGEKERQLAYWKAQLGTEHPVLQLPVNNPRRSDGQYTAQRHAFQLPVELSHDLHARAQAEGATLFMVLLAALQVLLARYSGQGDIRLGVPIANRHRVETEGLVGFFVNTQVMRNVVDGQQSLVEILAHAKTAALGAQSHQDLPFEQLVEALQPERNLGANPLFQVMFNHQRLDQQSLKQLPGLSIESYEIGGQEAQFELTVDTSEDNDKQVHVSFTFAKELLESDTIERMAGHYMAVLRALAQTPRRKLREIELLDDAERRQLSEWGVNEHRYADVEPLHLLIERRVHESPEALAVSFGQTRLSYGELNARANRLAHRLISLGVKPETRVGIALERSIDMVVGLLAILKTGGAYVPLDPQYPADRLAYMVEDSRIELVLTQSEVKATLPSTERLRLLELDAQDLSGELISDPIVTVHGESLAYVIYTSGSTGRPKGVGIPHRCLVEHAQVAVGLFGLTATDRILQFATLNFDGCVEQLFPPLLVGASIVLRGPMLWDSTTFYQELIDKQISVVDLTTAYWLLLVQDFVRHGIRDYGALRQVHVGGEAMPPEGLKAWREAGLGKIKLLNTYGPTEATVTASTLDCNPFVDEGEALPQQMPIGAPLAGRALRVMDTDLSPVPQGVAGELCIGGELLARGYLGRAGLSAERFIADPFLEKGSRLYRTGDLVRWNSKGQLEYLGRIDHQVKIRGLRIEMGEIEAQLLAQPQVREAVVVARHGPGGPQLVGYVSLKADQVIDAASLRQGLAAKLPDYMVPGAIVTLEALPLNANGKVDRNALPEPEITGARAYEAPQGEFEEQVAAIWSEVLGRDIVGRHDNFFELGGHSLLALTVLERMRGRGIAVQVRTLFQQPELAGFVQAIQQRDEGGAAAVPPNLIPAGCTSITPEMLTLIRFDADELARIAAAVPGGAAIIQDIYPLAPLQEGILFHHMLQHKGDTYVTPCLLSFDTKERLLRFVASLNRVIERHDILRTAVLWEGLSEPAQVVWRHAHLEIEWLGDVDVSEAASVAELLNQRVDPMHYRIDVRQAPMMRAVAAHDAALDRWLLQLPSHHLILDHTTLELLVDEIALIQQDRDSELPEQVPFRRFVAQARLGVSQTEHKAFFTKMLASVEEPTAPFGLLDVQGNGSDVEEARMPLGADLAKQVRLQAQRYGVSAASVFHLAWALLLSKTTGKDDVVFGTVLFGRMQGGQGAERALGMFINTLPIRIRIGRQNVEQCLRQTHAALAELLHHEHAVLSQAQQCSGLPATTPLFSALLNYRYSGNQGGKTTTRVWDGMEVLGGQERSNYPLDMSVDDMGEGFVLVAQVVKRVGAQRLCDYMQVSVQSLVEALAAQAGRYVCDVELLGAVELHRLNHWGVNEQRHLHLEPVHRGIEQQVQRRPETVAVLFGQESLTYEALNARANRLAHRLIALGVTPETRVGIALERSIDMVVGLLAILKAGGAYVPLDPEYPSDRLAYMAEDSSIELLLTHSWVKQRLPCSERLRPLELDALDLIGESESNPQVVVHPDSLAYVIYTSGSTGRPKGVGIPHRCLVEHAQVSVGFFGLTAADRMLQFATLNFDGCIEQLFPTLLVGASIVLRGPALWDSTTFYRELIDKQISVVDLTTAYWQLLVHDFVREGISNYGVLRQIHVGGEAMPPEGLRAWREAGLSKIKLLNTYGPTEATVTASILDCAPYVTEEKTLPKQMPIGVPLAGRALRVMGADLGATPQGVAGELCIGGALLARGYLGRAELTADRFIADPFDEGGGRLYRTGDLVRWNDEGQLEYLGRIDHQVKIRGLRIELGEVEAQLLAQPEVRAALVVAVEGAGGARLVGYVSTKTGRGIDDASLRARLSKQLPDYMVPSAILVLDELPLNANGKVDRKALPEPGSGREQEYEAPQGDVENALATMWTEVLGVDRVGRQDNFFELGGHSLSILRLQTQLLKTLSVQLPLRDYFENPTLIRLAETVNQRMQASESASDIEQMAALMNLLEN